MNYNDPHSQSSGYPFSCSTRGNSLGAFQNTWPPRAHGAPSNGSGYRQAPSTSQAPTSFSPVYATHPIGTFAINQAVQVYYEGTCVAGVIIAGLHRINTYNRLGYTVRFLVGKHRYVEGEFLQEHVRIAPA